MGGITIGDFKQFLHIENLCQNYFFNKIYCVQPLYIKTVHKLLWIIEENFEKKTITRDWIFENKFDNE